MTEVSQRLRTLGRGCRESARRPSLRGARCRAAPAGRLDPVARLLRHPAVAASPEAGGRVRAARRGASRARGAGRRHQRRDVRTHAHHRRAARPSAEAERDRISRDQSRRHLRRVPRRDHHDRRGRAARGGAGARAPDHRGRRRAGAGAERAGERAGPAGGVRQRHVPLERRDRVPDRSPRDGRPRRRRGDQLGGRRHRQGERAVADPARPVGGGPIRDRPRRQQPGGRCVGAARRRRPGRVLV